MTGYEILRSQGGGDLTSLISDTASTAATYTDTTANTAGETYAYQVKALRGSEASIPSNPAQVQIPHPLEDLAPTGLSAEVVDDGVDLNWQAPAADAESVTGYRILRAQGVGDWTTLVADTGSAATSHTDTTATEPGETYAYRVKALRGSKASILSDPVQVNLPDEVGQDGNTIVFIEGGDGRRDIQPQSVTAGTWTATLTVGEDADGFIFGYASAALSGESTDLGELSPLTFTLASVTYTVHGVFYDSESDVERLSLAVAPALPSGFTLDYGATSDLDSDNTDSSDALENPDGFNYAWSITDPNWSDGDTVTVTLDLDTETLVKNTGQTLESGGEPLSVSGNSKSAQEFTTGDNGAGYALSSITIMFDSIVDTSATSNLTATLNEESSGDPGSVLCTLEHPASHTEHAVNTYTAPDSCPKLNAETAYFLVIARTGTDLSVIALDVTAGDNEDSGGHRAGPSGMTPTTTTRRGTPIQMCISSRSRASFWISRQTPRRGWKSTGRYPASQTIWRRAQLHITTLSICQLSPTPT